MVDSKLIAKIAIDSPLPQLDHLFDYLVPQSLLDEIAVGLRVKVPFGRAKTLQDGFVVELSSRSEFKGELGEIAELVSGFVALPKEQYELCRQIADRQAVPISEVLRSAIPKRAVSVEKKFLAGAKPAQLSPTEKRVFEPQLTSALVRPAVIEGLPVWISELLELAKRAISQGESAIIVLPDFRDHDLVQAEFVRIIPAEMLISYSTKQTGSARYEAFTRCQSQSVSVVIGSRNAIYAPVNNLGLIAVWDDGDRSHQDLASPYAHTRDIALIRQQVSNSDLVFLSHSRTAEIQRLLNIGYLKNSTKAFPVPSIAVSDSDSRVDSLAWTIIRKQLTVGPVLVQVGARGISTSAFCADCYKRAECSKCNGPLWIDERGHSRCRWCNAINIDYRCECGQTKLKFGRPGSTRTVAEFGNAFPGARIIEVNADNRPGVIRGANTLVISTVGSEPASVEGYSAVVILDAQQSLSRDSLRATEDSVRGWSNAIALMAASGAAALVGINGTLGQDFALWNQEALAQRELASRNELRFPPAIRMATVTSSSELIKHMQQQLLEHNLCEVLGPVSVANNLVSESRLILKFEYSNGLKLAALLKALSLQIGAGQVNRSVRSGKSQRVFRIKMDDIEVI